MAIVRTASPTQFAPVTHKCYSADGALQELKFDAQFKRLKQSEAAALFETQSDGQIKHKDVLDSYMIGWRGVTDESKAPIPYTKEDREALCDEYVGMLGALAQAFYDTLNPKAAAHLASKN
jgi:hypothetical protein